MSLDKHLHHHHNGRNSMLHYDASNSWIMNISIYLFIGCFTTTFLQTHHSLLAKLGRWGWLMRMRLAWKKSQKTIDTSTISQKDYIEVRPEVPGVRAKDLIHNFAIIGNWGFGKVQVRHAWRHLVEGGGWNPSHVAPTTRSLILVNWEPTVLFAPMNISNKRKYEGNKSISTWRSIILS